MKIKKINIRNYGPLLDFSLQPGDFDLVFGLNESGKTAIVEALTYVLFRNLSPRYGKPESISVGVEMQGKIHSLPAKKIPPIALSDETAGLMYVQASESSFYETKPDEARFWDSIKLLLSQAGQNMPFAKIITKIRESIGYQPKRNEWKTEKKKIIEDTARRLTDLETFIKERGETEKKQLELQTLSEQSKKIKRELQEIADWKKYTVYRELKQLHDRYIDIQNQLALFARYDEKYYETWQRLEAEKAARSSHEEQRHETAEEIASLEKELVNLGKKQKFFKDYGFEDYLATIGRSARAASYFYPLLIFLVGIIALILKFRFGFSIIIPLVLVGAGITALAAVFYKNLMLNKASLEKEVWLAKAQLVMPELKKIEELPQKIIWLDNEKIRIETLLAAKNELLIYPGQGPTVKELENAIAELRMKTGLAEIVQLKQKLDEKKVLTETLAGAGAGLFNILAEKDPAKWLRLIEERKAEPPDKECDTSREKDLTDKLSRTTERLSELQNDIRFIEEFRKKQYNIENDRQVFEEIAGLRACLKNYDLEKNAAVKAEEIFNTMSSELDDFIDNVLHGQNSLSSYFKTVTGKYETVRVLDGDFVAVDASGSEYAVKLLSSGTKDQLMLCFRMAALKRLYPSGAFLILDDAFIFSDWARRQRLVELLKEFIKDGNQVIYFTSDDHTRDLFQQCGARVTRI